MVTQAELTGKRNIRFELFVSAGFDEFEVAAVSRVLAAANKLQSENKFEWSYVSDTPGLLSTNRS